jgi:NADP-dependent 3-hydroxy acid dehydrogenase YdfG
MSATPRRPRPDSFSTTVLQLLWQALRSAAMKTAVITGASSGIGAATARALAGEGYRTVLAARRLDRLEALAAEIDGEAIALDVADPGSVAAMAERTERCDVLVNNAGGALGLEPVAEADEENWLQMYEANVMGTMRMTKALMPLLASSGDGHVVTVTSIAAIETYRGGAGYNAAKHGQRAMLRVLRLEHLGEPIRFTEVAPGMVETEFSLVRFGGDEEAAHRVYEGMEPLRAEDVAECIRWALVQPPHVNVDEIVVRPRDQATAADVHRQQAIPPTA